MLKVSLIGYLLFGISPKLYQQSPELETKSLSFLQVQGKL